VRARTRRRTRLHQPESPVSLKGFPPLRSNQRHHHALPLLRQQPQLSLALCYLWLHTLRSHTCEAYEGRARYSPPQSRSDPLTLSLLTTVTAGQVNKRRAIRKSKKRVLQSRVSSLAPEPAKDSPRSRPIRNGINLHTHPFTEKSKKLFFCFLFFIFSFVEASLIISFDGASRPRPIHNSEPACSSVTPSSVATSGIMSEDSNEADIESRGERPCPSLPHSVFSRPMTFPLASAKWPLLSAAPTSPSAAKSVMLGPTRDAP